MNLVVDGYDELLQFSRDDEIFTTIINLLTKFAKVTRYYNLDILTNKKLQILMIP